MGIDCGCGGIYGVHLTPDLIGQPLLDKLTACIGKARDENPDSYEDEIEDAASGIATDTLLAEVSAALAAKGIVVPVGSATGKPLGPSFQYHGTHDDAPGRCSCPEEAWFLGWGIFTLPDHYPPMHDSFVNTADFHTWVWVG